jgi:type II secretory pathway predicted ATPase ExeA
MNLEFYQLRRQPFGVTPDPQFLYFGASHEPAFSALLSSVKERRGFSAVIAKPGMGKTSLLFKLLELLKDSARTGFLFQTHGNSREVLSTLLHDLEADPCADDWPSMQKSLNSALMRESKANRQVVVVIDEAQNLSDDAFESLRLLSNFEKPDTKLLHIVLAGQPALSEKLSSPGLAQLRQRLSVVVELAPFTLGQTVQYIQHRLKVAGYTGQSLFAPEALEFVAQASEGIPRIINNLCFHSLSIGASAGRKVVDLRTVHEAARLLEFERGQSARFEAAFVSDGATVLQDRFSAAPAPWMEPIDNKRGTQLDYTYRPPRKRISVFRIGSTAFACSVLFLMAYLVFGPGSSREYLANWFHGHVSEQNGAAVSSSEPESRLTPPLASQAPPQTQNTPDQPKITESKQEPSSETVEEDTKTDTKTAPDDMPSTAKSKVQKKNETSLRTKNKAHLTHPNRYKSRGSAKQYTVQVTRTETLFQFAMETYGRADWATVRKIREVNPQIHDPYEVLHQGQLIRIPAADPS